MRARLISLDGGETLELNRDLVLVGRQEDCDLRLDHKSISKQHCVLVKTEGVVLLRDLGSTNGTRVNGTRVRRAVLVPNDVVAFASFKFRVAFGADDIGPSVKTQAMNPDEIAELIKTRRSEAPTPDPDSPVEFHDDDLPDVYPEDAKDPES